MSAAGGPSALQSSLSGELFCSTSLADSRGPSPGACSPLHGRHTVAQEGTGLEKNPEPVPAQGPSRRGKGTGLGDGPCFLGFFCLVGFSTSLRDSGGVPSWHRWDGHSACHGVARGPPRPRVQGGCAELGVHSVLTPGIAVANDSRPEPQSSCVK